MSNLQSSNLLSTILLVVIGVIVAVYRRRLMPLNGANVWATKVCAPLGDFNQQCRQEVMKKKVKKREM